LTATSWKEFLVRAEYDEKPKQVQGIGDVQLLQETWTRQDRMPCLKAKNGKFTHKGSLNEEVNFCGLSFTTLHSTIGDAPEDDPNILNVESTTKAEVLLF
jgi:hypothetical protein